MSLNVGRFPIAAPNPKNLALCQFTNQSKPNALCLSENSVCWKNIPTQHHHLRERMRGRFKTLHVNTSCHEPLGAKENTQVGKGAVHFLDHCHRLCLHFIMGTEGGSWQCCTGIVCWLCQGSTRDSTASANTNSLSLWGIFNANSSMLLALPAHARCKGR